MKKYAILFYSLLATLNGLVAFLYLILIPSDSKNAWLFGYSPLRLLLMLVALASSVAFALFGLAVHRKQNWLQKSGQRVEQWLNKETNYFLLSLSCLVNLVGWGYLYLLTIQGRFGVLQASLERLAPLILSLAVLGGLTLGLLLVIYREKLNWQEFRQSQRRIFIYGLIVLVVFYLLAGGMMWSRLGLTADVVAWGTPGTPLLASQVLLVVGLGLCLVILSLFSEPLVAGKVVWKLDVLLGVGIWLVAVILWLTPPLKPSYFAPAPVPPNNEFYPYSDAALHDLIAQNVLIGEGLGGGGGQVVRRPLYAVFLVLLHLIGGQDYLKVTALQVLVLATLPVAAYWLGRFLRSRLAGVLVALLLIIQEHNAMQLSDVINVSHSRLLMSDVPTALGVIIFTLALMTWLRDPTRGALWVLLAGGILGAVMLIRPQAVVLLAAAAVSALIVCWRRPLVWLRGMLLLILGLLLCIFPWLWRNWVLTGELVFDEPSGAQIGMVAQRYSLYPAEESAAPLPGETGGEYSQRMTQHIITFVKTNPGEVVRFTAAHFLHNLVNLMALLPLSVGPIDLQDYVNELPFWFPLYHQDEGISLLGLLLNMAVVAVGIAATFVPYLPRNLPPLPKKLAREGKGKISTDLPFVPISIYLAYNLSNAVARNSGWRFMYPADWIGLLFYAIGLSQLIVWLLTLLGQRSVDLLWLVAPQRMNDFQEGEIRHPLRRAWLSSLLLAIILLAFGALLPFSEKLFAPRYTMLSGQAMVAQLSQNNTLLAAELEQIEALVGEDGTIALTGRLLYPRFYKAAQGIAEGSISPAMRIRDYNRLSFNIIGPRAAEAILPIRKAPRYFPNAADAFVFGCWDEDHLRALAVVILSNRSNLTGVAPGDVLYLAEPFEYCNN